VSHTHRLDDVRVAIDGKAGLSATLFARADVPIEPSAIREVHGFLNLPRTIESLKSVGYLTPQATLERMVLTPDFHRGDGGGIPIGTCLHSRGFVIPKAVGSDICCGMRLLVTDIDADAIDRLGPTLDDRLRHLYFEGGRNIALTATQRRAVFASGLPGLVRSKPELAGAESDPVRHHAGGGFRTDGILDTFADFIAGSEAAGSGATSKSAPTRDDQIGSIGGGNHFVELQRVDDLVDRRTAWRWGVRPDKLAIMAHSGSLSLGAQVNRTFQDLARRLWPKAVPAPDHDLWLLPTVGPHAGAGLSYLSAMGNAANFAVVNRFYLTRLALRALAEALGRPVAASLVYDLPHNLIWPADGGEIGATADVCAGGWLHRKGACPARCDPSDRAFPDGAPVIVPGSMGTSSWLLRGCGNPAALSSAAHGAGRITRRGAARHKDTGELARLRLVTKVDLKGLHRADIRRQIETGLLEEAPSCYKDPTPVIRTLTEAGIAAPVARLEPLLTVKG